MKFKIDENLPTECADVLRQAGHDAKPVWNQGLRGKADPLIADVCQEEERILVTLDRDFPIFGRTRLQSIPELWRAPPSVRTEPM